MAKKAILFDLDGTLWDSSREVAVSWGGVLADHGIHITTADVQSVMGQTIPEIAGLLFPDLDWEKRKEILAQCSAAEEAYLRAHGANPFPALEQTLKLLSQTYFLGIISNCQEGYIETFLDYYDLWPYITDTENAGRTGRPKGENIRLVMERNGLEEAIYVGDTQKDQEAAAFAGLPFVHAAYGFGKVEGADYVLPALSGLPALAECVFPPAGE